MPQARDDAGNIWETDAQGNAVRLLQPAQGNSSGAFTIGQPNPAAAYEAPKAAADLANTQTTIEDRDADNKRADKALEGDLYSKGVRVGANGQIEAIPGWVKPGASPSGPGALTAEMRGTALNQYGTLANLAGGVNDLRKQYEEHFAGRNPLEGAGAYVPFIREQDRIFNDRSGSLTAFIATALGLSGQQFNTPAEQKLFIQSILPKAGDTDGQIVAKLNTLEELIGAARTKGRATLGLTDKDDPLLADTRFNAFMDRTGGAGGNSGGPTPAPKAAGLGATQTSIPIPAEMQAEHEAYLRQNWGRVTPDGYAAFRVQLDEKYGFNPDTEGYRAFAPTLNERAARGGPPEGLNIPAVNRDLSQLEQLRNDAVSNPVGAFAATAVDSTFVGIPGIMAGGKIDALRDANPIASTLGDITGGVIGTMAGGTALRAGAGTISNPMMANLVANPLTADALYSTAYGATQADDPLTGGAVGLASALGGNVLGRQIGRFAPRLVGAAQPADALNRGERAVYDAVGDVDPVLAALTNASDLGVPATIADVSGPVNTLTGAALRRSPAAAAGARDMLQQRGQGQYDRLLAAVERDLGPVENIAQRSEDLIGQARAQAGPLYDAAYAAPGASVFQIDDLASRPSMQRALTNAVRIAQEEGRDPAQLGFVFDDAGNAIMTNQPSWHTLDYVKRGLDDVLEGYRDRTTGRLVLDTEGRAVNDTLRDLVARMDTANPDYATARAAYAGPAAERDAMRRGQAALRMSPDQLAVNVGNSSPAQVDQMQLGFQSALGETAGRYRNNSNPFAMLNTPAMEQRLATLYPDGDTEIARLLSQRDLEADLAGSTNRLVGNSLTAERQMADQAFEPDSMMADLVQGGVETLVTGAPVATAMRTAAGRGLGTWMRDRRTLGFGRGAIDFADQIAQISLDPNSAQAALALRDIRDRASAQDVIVAELMRTAQSRGGHVGAGAAGALVAQGM